MPQSAKRAKQRQAQTRAPEDTPARGPKLVTVRMLVGASAGQTRNIPLDAARGMCTGWQPQAELVSMNPSETRETR